MKRCDSITRRIAASISGLIVRYWACKSRKGKARAQALPSMLASFVCTLFVFKEYPLFSVGWNQELGLPAQTDACPRTGSGFASRTVPHRLTVGSRFANGTFSINLKDCFHGKAITNPEQNRLDRPDNHHRSFLAQGLEPT
jgi:hypothetical protein